MKLFLLALFFTVAFSVSTNCNASQGTNVLNTENCEDMDKCTIDCSRFVRGCTAKPLLGLNLDTEYSERVCRNDFYKERDSIQKSIEEHMEQRMNAYGFYPTKLSNHLLRWQVDAFKDDETKFNNYGNPNLDHPLQALYVFGKFFGLFGDMCKSRISKDKQTAESQIISYLKRFLDGENVFKLRGGTTKNTFRFLRSLIRRYYFRAQSTKIISRKRTDDQILDIEYKLGERKMIDLLLGGKAPCPCNLIIRFMNDFHSQNSQGFRQRLGFYAIEGWKSPDECRQFGQAFYNSALVSQNTCISVCGKLPVIPLQSFADYQVETNNFSQCSQGDVYGRENEFK